jgi:hypothetical protein
MTREELEQWRVELHHRVDAATNPDSSNHDRDMAAYLLHDLAESFFTTPRMLVPTKPDAVPVGSN